MIGFKYLQAFSQQTTRTMRVHSTFITFTDKVHTKLLPTKNILSVLTSLSTETNTIRQSISEYLFEYINNEYFIVASVMILLLLAPLLILTIMLKNVGNICLAKICCRNRKKLDLSRSGSALSGEIGCIMRFRKNKNIQSNAKQSNEKTVDVLSKANVALKNCFTNKNATLPNKTCHEHRKSFRDKFRSIAFLISIKNDNEKNSKMFLPILNQHPIKKAIMDSDEDISGYTEYAQKSLIDIRSELIELDRLNHQRLNFIV